MFIIYIDESGDSGLIEENSPTRYYVLSGLVMHELRWNEYLDRLVHFRKRMRSTHGLLMREEIHCARLINRPGELVRIPRQDRLTILRHFANELALMTDLNIINVVVDKMGKPPEYDVTETAWTAMLQRFHNTMSYRNYRGPVNADDSGLVVPDAGDVKKITNLLRRLRRHNPVPHRRSKGPGFSNVMLTKIVEDPYFKNSEDSYFIQAADLAAFLLYQKLAPSAYAKKKNVNNYFNTLNPVLCKVASSTDQDGIVYL